MQNSKRAKHHIVPWLLQRISGAALVFLVAIHVWTLHYAHPDVAPSYPNLLQRLHTFGFIILDISLLVLALFHGLNGVRNIVLDYTRKDKLIRRWTILLWSVGVIFSAFGAAAIVKIVTIG